jgi:micrococcal nuclease
MKQAMVFLAGLVLFVPAGVWADEAAAPSIPVFEKPDFAAMPVYSIVEVIRGDTVTVGSDANTITVRLIGADTPPTVRPSEPGEQVGIDAFTFTRNLLIGEKVYLLTDALQPEADNYHRTPAYLYRFPDGLFVNAEIIRQGYGRADTEDPFKYRDEFGRLEQFAKAAKKGLWSVHTHYIGREPPPAAPSAKPAAAPVLPDSGKPDTEDPARQKEVIVYIMRVGTTYHTASCRLLDRNKISIPLSEAKRHYTPCSGCKPPL